MSAPFYKSKEWRALSRLFLLSKNYVCERCGNPACIAHHKIYLTPETFGNPEIALNPENLEALCLECHNREHFGKKHVMPDVTFDEKGDLIKR